MTGSLTQPDQANALDIDAIGNIYVAGVTGIAPPFDNEFAIIKLTAAGQLDNTFDFDGKKIYNPTASNEFGRGIAVQPDGKIIFGGTVGTKMYLVRIDSTGNYDTSFNGNGLLSLNFAASSEMFDLALDSLNSIVVVGVASTMAAVVRIMPTGVLDNTFGTAGAKTFNVAGLTTTASEIKIVDGVKIMVSGTAGNSIAANEFYVARLDSAGNLDTTFNSTGFVTHSVASGVVKDDANAMSILADGRIFVTGTSVYSFVINEDVAMLMLKPVTLSTDLQVISSFDFGAVYPNPAHTALQVVSKTKTTLVLMDVRGCIFRNIYLNEGANALDVTELKQGLYLLRDVYGNKLFKFTKH